MYLLVIFVRWWSNFRLLLHRVELFDGRDGGCADLVKERFADKKSWTLLLHRRFVRLNGNLRPIYDHKIKLWSFNCPPIFLLHFFDWPINCISIIFDQNAIRLRPDSVLRRMSSSLLFGRLLNAVDGRHIGPTVGCRLWCDFLGTRTRIECRSCSRSSLFSFIFPSGRLPLFFRLSSRSDDKSTRATLFKPYIQIHFRRQAQVIIKSAIGIKRRQASLI